VIDEHFYNTTPRAFQRMATRYDSFDRSGPKIFVGGVPAAIEGRPTPDLNAALGDAAWLTGLERKLRPGGHGGLCAAVREHQSRRQSVAEQTSSATTRCTATASPSYHMQAMFRAAWPATSCCRRP